MTKSAKFLLMEGMFYHCKAGFLLNRATIFEYFFLQTAGKINRWMTVRDELLLSELNKSGSTFLDQLHSMSNVPER